MAKAYSSFPSPLILSAHFPPIFYIIPVFSLLWLSSASEILTSDVSWLLVIARALCVSAWGRKCWLTLILMYIYTQFLTAWKFTLIGKWSCSEFSSIQALSWANRHDLDKSIPLSFVLDFLNHYTKHSWHLYGVGMWFVTSWCYCNYDIMKTLFWLSLSDSSFLITLDVVTHQPLIQYKNKMLIQALLAQ